MAYGLKYTQFVEKGSTRIQIRVFEKDWDGATYGMAHLTGASLQVIGGQSDILTPVIKTAFSFSLADCWDEGSTRTDGTQCVNAAGEKCGRWEEFYTPDATKFKVVVSSAPVGGTASVIWTGYVTPDSWSENLIYRGSVTITARDMLGSLQDREFDLTGRVTILQIVQGALAACFCPMTLTYTAAHFLVNSNGSSILAHTIAASTFSGDTWQKALEETLESLGLVLRWNGADGVVLTSLRYLAADTQSGSHDVEFVSRSGLRELDPALKLITETFDIDLVGLTAEDPDASRFTATGSNLTQRANSGQTLPHDKSIPGYTLTAPASGGWSGGLALPRPTQVYQGGGAIPDRNIYFPTDIIDDVSASWSNPDITAPFSFRLSQDGPVMRYTITGGNTIASALAPFVQISLLKMKIVVRASVGGEYRYLGTNGWQVALAEQEIAPGDEVVVPALSGGSGYTIIVKKLVTEYENWNIAECTIVALSLEVTPPTSSTTPTEYKTTTIYDESNNVTITRKPTIGSASVDFCTPFSQNLLALGNAVAPDAWNWPGQSSYYPLAVMIQAQALCYHSAAASVFTGTFHDKAAGESLALPGCGYTYYGRVCTMVSGTFDLVSGFVGQANLREVYSWEQVWGTFAPEYTQASGAGKGSTSATGSGGSSVTPGGGGGSVGGLTLSSVWESLKTNTDSFAGTQIEVNHIPDLSTIYQTKLPFTLDGTSGATYNLATISTNAAHGNTAYGYFDANGKVKQANLPSMYIGRTAVAFSAANTTLLGITAISNAASSGASDKSRIEWDSTNEAWHFIGSLYADGFVSGGGLSQGGGASGIDLAAMWASLTNTNADAYATTKIHANHIPDMASTYGYAYASALSAYLLASTAASTYVAKAGDTMTGALVVSMTDNAHIDFAPDGVNSGDIYVNGSGRMSMQLHVSGQAVSQLSLLAGYNYPVFRYAGIDHTIYHSGNLTKSVLTGLLDASGGYYLPLTGGTLSNSERAFLNINSTNANGPYVQFKISGTTKGYIGCYVDTGIDCVWLGAGTKRLFLDAYQTASLRVGTDSTNYLVYHTGNLSPITTTNWTSYIGTSSAPVEYATRDGQGNVIASSYAFLTANGAQTISNSASDAPVLILKGYSSYSSVQFVNSSGSFLGYFGVDSTVGLYFYDSASRKVYHSGNCNNSSTAWACSTLTASGNATISGNVGIGTSSPSEKVDIIGNLRACGVYTSGGVTHRLVNYSDNPWGLLFRTEGTYGGWSIQNQRESTTSECFPILFQPYGGNVGIGLAQGSNPAYTLDVAGIIHSTTGIFSDGYVSAGGLSTSSDRRLKDNVKPFAYSPSLLMAILPREWDWNALTPMSGHAAGLVAQEVEPLIPYAVTERTYKQLYYDMFHALEIAGLQDHERRIAALERENAELKRRLNLN